MTPDGNGLLHRKRTYSDQSDADAGANIRVAAALPK
jgi:hypothetical protein